jgi:hypothetical protein
MGHIIEDIKLELRVSSNGNLILLGGKEIGWLWLIYWREVQWRKTMILLERWIS